MARFGCFSIRTVCRSCGLPVPVNGPVLTLACTECFDEMRLTPDTLAGFMNDFEEEYEGLSEGEGRSGTLMGGDGTFNYTYHRISPRCGSCGKSLEISSPAENSAFRCGGCGKLYHVAAVPEEYAKEVPSARFSITPEPLPESAAGKADENNGKKPEKPVVMACPQCGVALSLTAAARRITGCRYCGVEVYVPDPVWLRLHPVKTAEDWFVWFEGKNRKQLESERRVKDLEEEKAELKAWRLRKGPAKRKGRFWPILAVIGGFFVVLIGFSLVLSYLGYEPEQIRSVMSRIGKPLGLSAALIIPALFVFRIMFAGRLGRRKKCKQALAALAKKHGWKHEAAGERSGLGFVTASYKGRDIEINPGDEYALEADIHGSPLYLKTEPPGYPQDGVCRFTTGDEQFDSLFPFRYAEPSLAGRIELSREESRRVLHPLYWFLGRWGKKLGRMKIDWSGAAVHLMPGHQDRLDSGQRYLLAEDLESLLEDMVLLVRAIDDIAAGKESNLPEN